MAQKALGGPLTGRIVDGGAGVLLASVNASADRMAWLEDSDGAALDLAREYARRIDEALDAARADPADAKLAEAATKALYLGPHLLNTLKALGGTPDARRDVAGPGDKAKGKLAVMREARDRAS